MLYADLCCVLICAVCWFVLCADLCCVLICVYIIIFRVSYRLYSKLTFVKITEESEISPNKFIIILYTKYSNAKHTCNMTLT